MASAKHQGDGCNMFYSECPLGAEKLSTFAKELSRRYMNHLIHLYNSKNQVQKTFFRLWNILNLSRYSGESVNEIHIGVKSESKYCVYMEVLCFDLFVNDERAYIIFQKKVVDIFLIIFGIILGSGKNFSIPLQRMVPLVNDILIVVEYFNTVVLRTGHRPMKTGKVK